MCHPGCLTQALLLRSLPACKPVRTYNKGWLRLLGALQATSLMAPYLPPRSSNSPFSEGGGLYALGLIHANHGEPIIPFLLESLRNSSHEVAALLPRCKP